MPHNPVRYVVTNTEKVILVTHDYKFAMKIAKILLAVQNPERLKVKVTNKL
jgi:ABC-type polar amino acid transport system ATPase subunit